MNGRPVHTPIADFGSFIDELEKSYVPPPVEVVEEALKELRARTEVLVGKGQEQESAEREIAEAVLSEAAGEQPGIDEPETIEPWEEVVVGKNGSVRQAGAGLEGKFLAALQGACEKRLFLFARCIMGRNYLTRDLHMEFCDDLQLCPPFRKLRLMPRDHAKTSVVSHCLPVHIIIQPKIGGVYFPGLPGSECRIMLAGETETRAKNNLRVVASAFEGNRLLRALWPAVCWEKPKAQAPLWNDRAIIVPRATEYPDPTLFAVGVGGAVTGARPNVQIKDDLVSVEAANSDVVMESTIDWHTVSRALLDEFEHDTGLTSLEFIIGCLTADAEVTMADGTRKRIADVRPGDSVWAADTDKTFTVREVEAVVQQGTARTFTINTTSHQIRATPNHPFLVSSGAKDLTWKRADALREGDLIVAQKEIPGAEDAPRFEEEFCWLFGFMLGDGWLSTRERKGYVCFATGIDEAQNQRVVAALARYLPCNKLYRTKFGYYRTDSVQAAKVLHGLGFSGTAKTKRLPQWVYTLSPQKRRALLQGFCDADGSRGCNEYWNVEISNKDLLMDLRHLATLCGVRIGELDWRERMIQPPHSKTPVRALYYRTGFNFGTVEREETCNANLDGGKNVGRDTKLPVGLRFERVVNVFENLVQEPVYDLTVQGTPSFFANGLAVHNTRWAVWDLYSHIMENDPTVDCKIRSIVEDGKAIWPERFTLEKVEALRKSFGAMFYLLYMNSVHNPELTDFDTGLLRYFKVIADGQAIEFTEGEADRAIVARMKARDGQPLDTPAPVGQKLTAENFNAMMGLPGREEFMAQRYKEGSPAVAGRVRMRFA